MFRSRKRRYHGPSKCATCCEPPDCEASVDPRNESLSRRVRAAHDNGIPFVVVIGARELAGETVSLRVRAERSVSSPSTALERLSEACTAPL